jgi:hypothetical protein
MIRCDGTSRVNSLTNRIVIWYAKTVFILVIHYVVVSFIFILIIIIIVMMMYCTVIYERLT